VLDVLQSVLQSLLDVFANVFFLLAVMLFMVMDAAHFHDRLAHVEREKPEIVAAFRGFASGTRTYLVVSTVFGAIVAVIDGIALAIIGVPLPVLWGLLAFITNYIPNIGFVIGLIPPALLALLGGGVGDMIAVIVVYSVINFVIQSLIQPKFVGNAVGLSVTLTFVSLVFWAWVLGALGALLAIPLTLLTKALLLDIDPSMRWVNGLITSGRPPDAAADEGRADEGRDDKPVERPAAEEAGGIEPADEEPADAPPRTPTG
jgi:predicted PurR-regulated permease PerM